MSIPYFLARAPKLNKPTQARSHCSFGAHALAIVAEKARDTPEHA
jgi:hypothetical protein